MLGTDGNDKLIGDDATNDHIQGLGGNDILAGLAGSDTLDGGEGIEDAVSYGWDTGGVLVDISDPLNGYGMGGEAEGDRLINVENVWGGSGNDTLIGGAIQNVFLGKDGNDSLAGGGGNDALTGDSGADTLDGGADSDTAVYSSSPGGVLVDLALQGVAQVGAADSVGDILIDIESVYGSSFNDTLYGGAGRDGLSGSLGDDFLDGRGGADRMVGGEVNDTYFADDLFDEITELAGQGYDIVNASASFALGVGAEVEVLQTTDAAGAAAINLTGSAFANVLFGNAGNNILDGAGGADQMSGFGGNDTYLVDNAFDVVLEAPGGGYDTVRASTSYTLGTWEEIEVLAAISKASTTAMNLTGSAYGNAIIGNAGANKLLGQGGSDVLRGESGNDKLYGGSGNDVLFGGNGIDRLSGASGKDYFAFNSKLNKKNTNRDKIVDYSVKYDTIFLDNAVFKKLGKKGSIDKPVKINKKFFTVGDKAKDSNDYIIYNKMKGILYYDADGSGSGAALQITTLSKKLKMTYSDFFVI